MKRSVYGLIGYPLEHSFSPGYFAKKFEREHINAQYELFPLKKISLFPDLLKQTEGLKGLNVTAPYKEEVMDFLDKIDEPARKAGAVNCIDIKNNISTGYNTDIIGFEQSISPLLAPHHNRALVLGIGGASKAIRIVLEKLSINYQLVSRANSKNAISYADLTDEIIADHTIIINATPLGTWPDINDYPDIPYEALTPQHLLYDVVYNPAKTQFLTKGEEKGAAIKNGLEMLEIQAEASWNIWNS